MGSIRGMSSHSGSGSVDRHPIDDMCRAMTHRDPDSRGILVDSSPRDGRGTPQHHRSGGEAQLIMGETTRVCVVRNLSATAKSAPFASCAAN